MKKWSEHYFQIFRHTRLLTQIVGFSLAIMLVVDSTELIYRISKTENFSPELGNSVIKNIFLELFLAILLGSRFLLLFSEQKFYFWFSQFIWVFSIIFLVSQMGLTEFGGCSKNVFPMLGETLSSFFVGYLILSPMRQLATLICSIDKIFIK